MNHRKGVHRSGNLRPDISFKLKQMAQRVQRALGARDPKIESHGIKVDDSN